MLTSFGEPIPIVLTTKHPMQANELLKRYSGRYNRLLFWIQNDDNEDLFRLKRLAVKRRLNQFENLLPNAQFLLVSPKSGSSASSQKVIAQTSLTFIDARQALQLHQGLGRASFMNELDKLSPSHSQTIAIITGNETTLSWLEQKLPELKRAGVELVPPPKINS